MTKKEILEKFKQVGSTEISNDSELETTILDIFKEYPTKYITQPDLVKVLNKSNPFVNKILRRLVSNGKISRTKNGNKFYYKLFSSKN